MDHVWRPVPPADLLRLTKTEAQAWIALHFLLSDPECRRRWPLHSYRKATIMRVRRYLVRALVVIVSNHLDQTLRLTATCDRTRCC